jgi:hypothetical protein
MSSEITVYLHKKGERILAEEDDSLNVDTKGIPIFYLSTTPTRALHDVLSSTYFADPDPKYGYCRVLTDDMLHDIEKFYGGKIEDLRRQLKESKEKMASNTAMMEKTKSVDIFRSLSTENDNLRDLIEELTDEIDMNQMDSLNFEFAKGECEMCNGFHASEDKRVYELVYAMD